MKNSVKYKLPHILPPSPHPDSVYVSTTAQPMTSLSLPTAFSVLEIPFLADILATVIIFN